MNAGGRGAQRLTGKAAGGAAVGEGDDCPVRVLHPEAIARAQEVLRPDEQYVDLAETFRALGDASRARILHALLAEELCVCDLAALAGLTESAVSQHLRVLRARRIVRPRKAGRAVYYRLEDACIRALLTIALTHLDDPLPAAGDTAPGGAPRARGKPRHQHAHPHPQRRTAAGPAADAPAGGVAG